MKQIFVINGEAGCGKDTFVSLCDEVMKDCDYNHFVKNVSMVDKVKEIAKIVGWDGKKDPKSRKFLSDLKDLCDEYNQMSYRAVEDEIDSFLMDSTSGIMFIHAREPKDIERICEDFDAYSLVIVRHNYSTNPSNHTDMNVYDYDYNYVVTNPGDSKENFKADAIRFLDCIKAI